MCERSCAFAVEDQNTKPNLPYKSNIIQTILLIHGFSSLYYYYLFDDREIMYQNANLILSRQVTC